MRVHVCLAGALMLAAPLAVCGEPAHGAELRGVSDELPAFECVIEPSEIVDVGSSVAGVIEAVRADRSDIVAEGAVIAELESDVERAAVELAEARAALTTGIELRRLSAEHSRRRQSRSQALYERNVISLQDIDELRTETGVAQLQVRQAQESQRLARLELLRTRKALARRTIRSPIDGVVMERFKAVGEYVEDQAVMRLARLDPLHVEIILPVELMGRIAPGMRAMVTPDVPGQSARKATVARVDRVADAASATFGARLTLANTQHEVPSGVRCRLEFTDERPAPAPVVSMREPSPEATPERAGSAPGMPAPAAAGPGAETVSGRTGEHLPREAAPATHELAQACYTVGPLHDAALADRLAAAVGDSDTRVALREERGAASDDMLVLAAAAPGAVALRELIARLETAEVVDRLVLRQGPYAGRVSLGLYRGLDGAHRRRDALAEAGIEAEVVPRRPGAEVRWLELAVRAGEGESPDVATVVRGIAPRASVEPAACAALIASG